MAKKSPQTARRKRSEVAQAIAERRTRTVDGEVKLWEERIKFSEEQTSDRYRVYDENEKAYYGATLSEMDKRASRIARQYKIEINKLLPVIATQRERIMPKIPWHRLNAQKRQSKIDAARLRAAESSLNFLMRHPRMNYLKQASLFFLGGNLGLGAMEVTCTTDEGVNPEEGKDETTGKIVIETDPMSGEQVPDVEGGEPLLGDDGGFVRRGSRVVLDLRDPLDYFGLRYIHWDDLRFDTEGGNCIEDLAWLATRFSMRLDGALENPLFKRADREDMRRAAKSIKTRKRREIIRPPRPYEDSQFQDGDDDFLRITGWRCWDAETRQVIYLVDGLNTLGGKYEYPPWVGHSPIEVLKFHERLGEFCPQTEVEFARPILSAYNLFWSTLLNHLKRFKRKYIAAPNAFEKPEQRDQLLDPDDGLVLEARGGKNAVVALEDAYLDPAIYRMMATAVSDFFEVMGSAPEFLGIAQSGSATQAAIIDRRGVGREEEKREILAHALEGLGDKMLACLQANLPKELAVRIAGPDGTVWKKTVARPDIQGQFKCWIDLTEMQPQSQQRDIQQMLSLVQIMGPEFAFSSDAFTRQFFKTMSWPDPDIQADFTEMALMRAAMALQPQAQAAPTNGGAAKGGAKPTGAGKEAGNTTEGRSAGRTERAKEFGTLLGPGSTPRPQGGE